VIIEIVEKLKNFFISFLHAGFDDRPVTVEIQTRQRTDAAEFHCDREL